MPDAPEVAEAAPPAAAPQPATPAGGIEVGDAPWRRAARMTGAEPGGAWETAPFPVVAETPANEPPPEARQVAAPVAAGGPDGRDAGAGAESGRADRFVAVRRDRVPGCRPGGTAAAPASPWTEPEPARPGADEPALAQLPVARRADDAASAGSVLTADGAAQPADADTAAEPAEPVSRPLSDPDLTPLMGIPIIRPSRGRARPRSPSSPPRCRLRPEPAVPVAPPVEFPAPVAARHRHPRSRRRRGLPPAVGPDRDVPGRPAAGPPSRQPAARVVPGGPPRRRAGACRRRRPARRPRPRGRHRQDRRRRRWRAAQPARRPVPDDRQRGRLPAARGDPHRRRRGRSSWRCCCPARPWSSGTVRSGGEPVRDVRVAVRQDHDAVDEALTGGDGRYRFDDLAEGTYTVAASAASGSRRGAVEPRRGRRRATSTWTSWGRTAHADRDGARRRAARRRRGRRAVLAGVAARRRPARGAADLPRDGGALRPLRDGRRRAGARRWAVYGMDHRGHGRSAGTRVHVRPVRRLPRRLRHVPLRRRRRATPGCARSCSATAWAARSRSPTRWTTRTTSPGWCSPLLRWQAPPVPRATRVAVTAARPGGADAAPGRRGPRDDQPRRGRRRRLPGRPAGPPRPSHDRAVPGDRSTR